MSVKERRKYDRELKEQADADEDMKAERMMRDAIAVEKKRMGKDAVVIERMRGLIRLEDKDHMDYEFTIREQEFAIRPLNNGGSRLRPEDLGFMVYGKNVVGCENIIRELLKTCRTQMPEKLPLRDE